MEYQAQAQARVPAAACVGVGRRCLAIIIDSIVIGAVAGVIAAILGTSKEGLSGTIGALIYFLYYIILEATMGATIGKLALGIHVVKENGMPISWGDSFIRNILRIIDGLALYLVGAIFVWTSHYKQRLGDRGAHTLVVRNR